jgi:predicted flavoprotein YhiN
MPSRDPEYFEDVPGHIFAPGPEFSRLNIAIVGAGIAGLGAAIGLSQSGHDVEVNTRNTTSSAIRALMNGLGTHFTNSCTNSDI